MKKTIIFMQPAKLISVGAAIIALACIGVDIGLVIWILIIGISRNSCLMQELFRVTIL